MKNNQLIKTLICSMMCLFLTSVSFAGFEPGFLVTQKGDTLRGAFKFNMNGIKLRPEHGGKAQMYPLSQIVAYAYGEDGEMHYNFNNLFYTLTLEGEVQLYERISYTYSYNGQFTTTIVQHSYAVKRQREDELTLLRMTSTMGRGKVYFAEQASSYFQDFSALVSDIHGGVYNKVKTIPDMVGRYNDWWNEQQKSATAN
ncbi:MAG: hypothetical protein ABJO02_12515 [Reichenbachiella sp.]|uniref:hypothetical protein n=1 Tax=Reichenbachiella sp. TaxID=2184521 RepID=UPI003296D434